MPPDRGSRRHVVECFGPACYSAASFLSAGSLASGFWVSVAVGSMAAVSTHSRMAMGALSLLRGPSLMIRV